MLIISLSVGMSNHSCPDGVARWSAPANQSQDTEPGLTLSAAGELPHRVRKGHPAQDSDSTLTHCEVAEIEYETEGERTRFDRYTKPERLSLLGSRPQPG